MLVTCPECGGEISHEADPCPKCGLPKAGYHSKEYCEWRVIDWNPPCPDSFTTASHQCKDGFVGPNSIPGKWIRAESKKRSNKYWVFYFVRCNLCKKDIEGVEGVNYGDPRELR